MPKINLPKPVLFSNKLLRDDFEHLDVVQGNTFWPHDLLQPGLWQNTTLGVIDGKGLWSPGTIDSNITSHFCNATACYQVETISDFNTLEDKHPSIVTYVALKYIPGINNIEHYDVFSSDNRVLNLRLALLEIEKRLKVLAAANKSYIYVLNISLKIISRLHPLVRNNVEIDMSGKDLIHPIISRLYKKYSRFQIFVSGGNEAKNNSMHRLFIQQPEVISVASHDQVFQQSSFSNFGSDITTTTLGTTVSLLTGFGDGTSYSAPKMAAIGAIIMSIIPDLKNYELKHIIQQLSVPADDFFESHNKDPRLRLKTPVFIFDLVKFNEILNSKYSARVDKKLLDLINSKAKTYFLDNFDFVLPNNCVRFVMPNYDKKIRFNVFDSVFFAMNVSNSWPIAQGMSFLLSSGRLPPFKLTKLCYPNIDFDKKYDIENLLFQPEQITFPANYNGKVTVALKRTPEKIMVEYKIADDEPVYKEISYNGVGDIKNVMLGLSTSSAIKVSYLQPLQPYRVKELEDNDYSFTNIEPNLALQSNNSLAFTGAMLATAGLLFLFAARHFQKKASATTNATPTKSRLNI